MFFFHHLCFLHDVTHIAPTPPHSSHSLTVRVTSFQLKLRSIWNPIETSSSIQGYPYKTIKIQSRRISNTKPTQKFLLSVFAPQIPFSNSKRAQRIFPPLVRPKSEISPLLCAKSKRIFVIFMSCMQQCLGIRTHGEINFEPHK